MTIQGVTGEIRWSYLTAVAFGPYRLVTQADGTARLQGRVVSVDSFRSTQANLSAVLWIGKQSRRYPVLDLQINGDRLTATVGAVEKK